MSETDYMGVDTRGYGAAIDECRHDYLTMAVDTYCEAINGSVKRFEFKCRYCGDRIVVERVNNES